jgi:ATP-dependent helicase/DNAse subunit B
MPDSRVIFLLMFCIFTAVIFLWSVICEKNENVGTEKYVIIPVARDTENIELIAREIVLKAAEYYNNAKIIVYDMGASEEQLLIFRMAVGNTVPYEVITKPNPM